MDSSNSIVVDMNRSLLSAARGGSNRLGSSGSSNTSRNNGDLPTVAQFVAFVLWYIFLGLCLVLIIYCIYQRSLLLKARRQQREQEQQVSSDQMEQQHDFILRNLKRETTKTAEAGTVTTTSKEISKSKEQPPGGIKATNDAAGAESSLPTTATEKLPPIC